MTRTWIVAVLLLAGWTAGCRDEGGGDGGGGAAAGAVVLYTSVDEPVARPIVDAFTKRTGIAVVIQTDAEKNKSVGLARRLEAERDRPRADVWWGNEVFHTINLAAAGVLAPYASPAAADVPPLFKDPASLWAARPCGRRGDRRPRRGRIGPCGHPAEQVDPRPDRPPTEGKIAIAHPSAGTTSGHVAALYVLWGEDPARGSSAT